MHYSMKQVGMTDILGKTTNFSYQVILFMQKRHGNKWALVTVFTNYSENKGFSLLASL